LQLLESLKSLPSEHSPIGVTKPNILSPKTFGLAKKDKIMANGEQFENPANHKVDNLKEETGKNLLADAQIAQPPKAADKVLNAPDAPAAPADKLDQAAGDKAGDKTGSKLEQAVTANLADSAQEKIKSLNSSAEGQKLLTQEHGGKNVMEQWKDYFPLAYDKASLDNFAKK